MSNYRPARSVCIFTKLAQIKPYFKKMPLIDAIILLNYMVKSGMVLATASIRTNIIFKAIKSKNNKYTGLFMILNL